MRGTNGKSVPRKSNRNSSISTDSEPWLPGLPTFPGKHIRIIQKLINGERSFCDSYE